MASPTVASPSAIAAAAAAAADEEEDEIKVAVTNDLERKIFEAFDIFDVEINQTVQVREVSTILRGLGLCPTETDMKEIVEQVEHPRIPGIVHFRHFLPFAVDVITKHKYEPPTPEALMEAFKTLDPRGVGYVPKQEMQDLLTQVGETFSQDEIDEMFEIAIDPLSNNLTYEYYINQLVHEPHGEDSVYYLADVIEAEKAAKAAAEAARRKYFFG